jgi:hypothetical protein
MLREFGVPGAYAGTAAVLLPAAELIIAGALVPAATVKWGALGAVAILLAFLAAIAANLSRGRRPGCSCFGRLSSGPIGRSTLVRNAVLALAAVSLLFQRPLEIAPALRGWLVGARSGEMVAVATAVAALALVLIQGWALTEVAAQNGRLILRLETLERRPSATPALKRAAGLPVGSRAPAFSLRDREGATQTLEDLVGAGRPVLLAFTDPDCSPCGELLPDLVRCRREMASLCGVAIISRGAAGENPAGVLLQNDREVAQAYRAGVTPSAVVVLPDGRIGTPIIEGATAIRGLMRILPKLLGQAPVLETAR